MQFPMSNRVNKSKRSRQRRLTGLSLIIFINIYGKAFFYKPTIKRYPLLYFSDFANVTPLTRTGRTAGGASSTNRVD